MDQVAQLLGKGSITAARERIDALERHRAR
jgi:hypothetical protein